MEGADSLIAYLPREEDDAKETQKQVEERGGKCHLLAIDIRTKENCKKLIDTALDKLGGINILVNNAATQMQYESIKELPEYGHSADCSTQKHY
jgi:NAD(P)-dependent dehydrogenase (short-subunit alcohol dehydrogenase family)